MYTKKGFRSYPSRASMNMVYKSKQFGTELWLGDYYAATDYNLLKSKNVNSVLTAAAMLGVAYPSQLQMNHKTIHAFDIPTYKMTPHFDEAYSFIHQGLKRGNVLVHCAAGISRSTTCVLVYLMRTQGYTFNQSMQFVRAKRSIINPNYGFQNQLKKFEAKLKRNTIDKSQIGDQDGQKKAVLNFLKEKDAKQQSQKLSSTMSYQGQQTYNGFLRGKSVNYAQNINTKFTSTTGSSFVNRLSSSTNNRLTSLNTMKNNMYKTGQQPLNLTNFANRYFPIKVQAPKIVTIKK